MRQAYSRLALNERAVPFALLFISAVSFGLLLPWLGFYWDDWPVIYMTRTQGTAGFLDFYRYDRPFSAWTYILTAPILGTTPLAWHVFTLVLRWLTAVSLWASLRVIWPNKGRQVFWVALLFAVCPIFTQQFISVAYSQHWICFFLYFCSIYFMLRAQASRTHFYLFSALAVLLSLVQMLTMEYFLGLELMRPFILWLYFWERNPDSTPSLLAKRVTGSAWIYGLLLIGYIIWRMLFLRLPEADPNRPVFLDKLLNTPLQALVDLAQKAIQDAIYLVTSWFLALKPGDIDLGRAFSLAALATAVLATVLFWLVMSRYRPVESGSDRDRWYVRAMVLGVLAILLGTLPVWLIDRQVSVGALGARFSLAGMFGVSLLFVGFLDWLSPRDKAKFTVICILVGLAIHASLNTAKAFQDSWEKQRTFYWQLYWRAPYIPPGTAFISSGEIFPFVGLYSTSMGISLMYPPVQKPTEMPYWFFSYAERLFRFPNELVAGTVLEDRIRNYSFLGDSRNSILLEFAPEFNRCLQLVSPRDREDRDLPGSMRSLVSISNLTRIQSEAPRNWQPPRSIFGPEPEHGWCYYFEKAELSYHEDDWPEVIYWMDEAKAGGFAPTDMKEFLPLLDAYLQTDRIEPALALTIQMKRLSDKIDDRMCGVWVNASAEHTSSEFVSAFEQIRERLDCFD